MNCFVCLDWVPDIILVHTGGNDLGHRSMRELIRYIKFDFLHICSSFPDIIFLYCLI